MKESNLRVMAVNGSLHKNSVTGVALQKIKELLLEHECHVDELDFLQEPLPLFNPDNSYQTPQYVELQMRVEHAEVFLLGTPDYHGSMSSALKNFLDHFWKEFSGKLFATVVSSHEKGLTVTDQMRTVARQCNAWAIPYGVAFMEGTDVKDGKVVSDRLTQHLAMLARDLRIYGLVLSHQRQDDLAGTDHCFMARLRK